MNLGYSTVMYFTYPDKVKSIPILKLFEANEIIPGLYQQLMEKDR